MSGLFGYGSDSGLRTVSLKHSSFSRENDWSLGSPKKVMNSSQHDVPVSDNHSGTKMIRFPSSSLPTGSSNGETHGVFCSDVEPPFRQRGNVFFYSGGIEAMRPQNLRD